METERKVRKGEGIRLKGKKNKRVRERQEERERERRKNRKSITPRSLLQHLQEMKGKEKKHNHNN